MSAFTVGQLRLAALQRIRTGSGRSPLISRSTILIGTLGERGKRSDGLFVFILRAECRQRRLVQPLRPVETQYRALRLAIVAWADTSADLARDLYQDIADRRSQFGGRRGDQPLVHDRGRFAQQIAKQRRGNIGS